MKRMISASRKSEEFGDLYDAGNYDTQSSVYEQIDAILDRYGTQNDLVTDVFDRASPEDQEKLMTLAKKLGNNDEVGMTRDQLDQKFRELQRKSEKDRTTPYEDGFFDAMCAMAEAFGLDIG